MEPILTKYVREPNSFTLEFYLQHEGYEALKTALGKQPDEIIELVKASGLRGRGGAGFPAGMKWQFVDKTVEPRYIVCNADESEPGTFKDHLLMERNPHLLIEGCAIGCYAIGAKVAYIYIRGEFFHVQTVLEHAIDEAYAKGLLGKNILGSGFDCDVYVHRGAGSYEAGEETALLESLEGKRAQPRNKPPFPALVGVYGKPTAVNNVETLCNVPNHDRARHRFRADLGPPLQCPRPQQTVAGEVSPVRECGMPAVGDARERQSVKFYLVAVDLPLVQASEVAFLCTRGALALRDLGWNGWCRCCCSWRSCWPATRLCLAQGRARWGNGGNAPDGARVRFRHPGAPRPASRRWCSGRAAPPSGRSPSVSPARISR